MTRRRVDQETDVELLKKGRCDHVSVISLMAHRERIGMQRERMLAFHRPSREDDK